MSFDHLIPGERGSRLKAAILAALERVYDENVERFDAEGIGDDSTTFGFTISRNLWHVVEVAIQDIVGVEGRRTQNTFFLVVDEAFEIYFCKAPPGAGSVHVLTFDQSQVRGQIMQRNGSHLQLRIDLEGGTTMPQSDYTPAPYAVVVHFGDFEDGFDRAVVGSPYSLEGGETGWEWEHELRAGDDNDSNAGEVRDPSPQADPGSFGLRLREDADDASGGA